jgi:protein-tyrosine phosphatase
MIEPIGVLFVCTGNICRSPTADGVFAGMVASNGLGEAVHVDSAGTHNYHPGKSPDPRTRRAAARRGYDLEHLRAREIVSADFDRFEYVLAMDRANYHDLLRTCPEPRQDRVRMFLSFAEHLGMEEVPDPYYGGADGFETVLDLVEVASEGLIQHLTERLGERR